MESVGKVDNNLTYEELEGKLLEDDNELIPLNVTSETCGDHTIKIKWAKGREYREEDDSNIVKRIKSFGILEEGDVKFENEWIITNGSMMADDDMNRTFAYTSAFIEKRDMLTEKWLQDKAHINFILNKGENEEKFDHDTYLQKPEESDGSSEEEDFGVLTYDNFLDNGMKVTELKLMYEEEIVLKSSYVNIFFNYPIYREAVTFKLKANDQISGFTMGELALKVMQKYHMLVYLHKNFDVGAGRIVDYEIGYYDRCFRPVFEYEWTDNGPLGLIYNKEKDHWEVSMYNLI